MLQQRGWRRDESPAAVDLIYRSRLTAPLLLSVFQSMSSVCKRKVEQQANGSTSRGCRAFIREQMRAHVEGVGLSCHIRSDWSEQDFSCSKWRRSREKQNKLNIKSWQMSCSFSFFAWKSKFKANCRRVWRQYALKHSFVIKTDGKFTLILHHTPHCSRQGRKKAALSPSEGTGA